MLAFQVEAGEEAGDQGKFNGKAFEALQEHHLSCLREMQDLSLEYPESADWLEVDTCAGEDTLARVKEKAKEIREQADVFVLIGVGGSNNAARAVIEGIAPKRRGEDPEVIYAGNTLHPGQVRAVLEKIKGRRVYIECIAKNFETLEPGATFRVLRQEMVRRYGAQAHRHILACGTEGSLFADLCRQEGYDFFSFPKGVGGRYTALTTVGLLPMAVAGIDIDALVCGARRMQQRLFAENGKENAAYRYACFRNLCYKEGYRIEMLSSFEPGLRFFYKWWTQLFAESEGKEDKGIFPVTGEFSEELHSVGQFLQEGTPILFETFLEMEEAEGGVEILPDALGDQFAYLDGKDFREINRAAFAATLRAHAKRMPVAVLKLPKLDAEGFGELFYFFAFACVLSCKMMGVNPFDQPGVEAYKERMFAALGKGR